MAEYAMSMGCCAEKSIRAQNGVRMSSARQLFPESRKITSAPPIKESITSRLFEDSQLPHQMFSPRIT